MFSTSPKILPLLAVSLTLYAREVSARVAALKLAQATLVIKQTLHKGVGNLS